MNTKQKLARRIRRLEARGAIASLKGNLGLIQSRAKDVAVAMQTIQKYMRQVPKSDANEATKQGVDAVATVVYASAGLLDIASYLMELSAKPDADAEKVQNEIKLLKNTASRIHKGF